MILPDNTSIEKAYPVMCVTNEYLWRDYILAVDPEFSFSEQSLIEGNKRSYDVLHFMNQSTGEKLSFFFDVTSFYGIPGIILRDGDLPSPGSTFTLPDVFGEAGEYMVDLGNSRGIDVSMLTVTFKVYSSKMVSQHVAIWYHHNNNIDVTPIRDYMMPFDVPVLHGFRFWMLMFLHQFQHVLDWHDTAKTEIIVKGDYYKPVPGRDCLYFKELPAFGFANDLLNYTFYTHKPEAFEEVNELNAFGAAILHGFIKKLFTYEQIVDSLLLSKLEKSLEANLIEITKKAYCQSKQKC